MLFTGGRAGRGSRGPAFAPAAGCGARCPRASRRPRRCRAPAPRAAPGPRRCCRWHGCAEAARGARRRRCQTAGLARRGWLGSALPRRGGSALTSLRRGSPPLPLPEPSRGAGQGLRDAKFCVSFGPGHSMFADMSGRHTSIVASRFICCSHARSIIMWIRIFAHVRERKNYDATINASDKRWLCVCMYMWMCVVTHMLFCFPVCDG